MPLPHHRKAARAVLEAVESRFLFNATYADLSAGAYVQNWTNTTLLATTDDWTNVPSIVGYRGDELTSLDGADPQTLLTNSIVVDVNVNQTNSAFDTGGVTEFEIADPVVGIKGSGTASAPYLQFHLNNSGRGVIQMSYNLRDIDGGGNNSVQPVALQYRIADTGNWTNIPAGFVADASDGPSLTKVTNVNLTLPGAVINQPVVQVRVLTSNAAGTDEYIGVDDINISSEALPAFVLNEVDVNPPTAADSAFEYIELKGTPGTILNNVYVLGISGDVFEPGVVSASIALNNVAFGSNGLILIKGSAGGFASEDPNTTVVIDSSLTNGALRNGTFSVLAVYSPSNIDDFTTLDTDHNGTLESLPSGTQIIDSIGWKVNSAPSDLVYGTLLPMPGSLVPDAATRLSGNTTPNSASAWYYGDLNDTGLGNATKAYFTPTGINMPTADAKLTPGASNFAAPGAPAVQSTTFAYDNRPMALLIDFDKDVSASLVLSDGTDSSFILTNRDTSTRIAASNLTKTFGGGDIATLRFPGFTGDNGAGALPDGNYRLTIVAANVKDISNVAMTADVTYDFYVLNGDATRDRKVDTMDFNVLSNYFGSGAQVSSHGDFNYDTLVDSIDFGLLVGQFGKSLAAIPAPIAARSPFAGAASGDSAILAELQ